MSALKNLRLLIGAMSETEQKFSINYLKGLDSRGDKFDSKSQKLFLLLSEPGGEDLTESELAYHVYGKKKTPAFARLMLRLRDKLLEVLSNEINLIRGDLYGKRQQNRLIVRKRTNYAEIMMLRGLLDMAEYYLNGLLEITAQYELFEEELSVLRLSEELAYIRGAEPKEIEEILTQHIECRKQLAVLASANALLSWSRNPDAKGLDERLNDIIQVANQAPSANANYIIQTIQIEQAGKEMNYRAQRKFIQSQLVTAQYNPALFEGWQVGEVLLREARNAIHLKDYSTAISTINEAEHWLRNKKHSLGHEIMFLHFHALYYSNQTEEAIKLIETNVENAELVDLYWLSAAYARNKQPQRAFDTLKELSFLKLTENGCGGWPVLQMEMIMIDLGLSQNDKKLKAKIEKRRKTLLNVSERERAIEEILFELWKTNYDFKLVFQNKIELIKDLDREGTSKSWIVLSPELIPFSAWFKKHLKQQDEKE